MKFTPVLMIVMLLGCEQTNTATTPVKQTKTAVTSKVTKAKEPTTKKAMKALKADTWPALPEGFGASDAWGKYLSTKVPKINKHSCFATGQLIACKHTNEEGKEHISAGIENPVHVQKGVNLSTFKCKDKTLKPIQTPKSWPENWQTRVLINVPPLQWVGMKDGETLVEQIQIKGSPFIRITQNGKPGPWKTSDIFINQSKALGQPIQTGQIDLGPLGKYIITKTDEYLVRNKKRITLETLIGKDVFDHKIKYQPERSTKTLKDLCKMM